MNRRAREAEERVRKEPAEMVFAGTFGKERGSPPLEQLFKIV